MATGPGSTADRTAQNDSEGFVSRYNKFASLSLKRQRELLPIFRHRIAFLVDIANNREIIIIPSGELPGHYCMWANGLWKVDSLQPLSVLSNY
jgi:hypothetical protein